MTSTREILKEILEDNLARHPAVNGWFPVFIEDEHGVTCSAMNAGIVGDYLKLRELRDELDGEQS